MNKELHSHSVNFCLSLSLSTRKTMFKNNSWARNTSRHDGLSYLRMEHMQK